MASNNTFLEAIGGLGAWELILILLIVLLIFGAGKLPQIGDALGKGIKNFKKSASAKEEDAVDVTPKALEGKSDAADAKVVEVEPAKTADSA